MSRLLNANPKKIMSLLLAAVMVITLIPIGLFPLAANAATPTGTFDLSSGIWVDGNSSECDWTDPILTVGDGADIIVTGTSAGQRRIEVAPDAKDVNIILRGVTIGELLYGQASIWLGAGAEVTIALDGGTVNLLEGGIFCAGIQVPAAAVLAVEGQGELTAIGGIGAAGIGAGYEESCGEIIINGGNVTAVGGEEMFAAANVPLRLALAASGNSNSGGDIVINWSTNRDVGSFAVDCSTDGENFNTSVSSHTAVEELFDYSGTYTPIGKADLYFRVTQTDGDDTAVSNIVKMVYKDGAGYVQDVGDESGGIDLENDLVLAMVTDTYLRLDSTEIKVTMSKYVLPELKETYENIAFNIMYYPDLYLSIPGNPDPKKAEDYSWYTDKAFRTLYGSDTEWALISGSKLEYTYSELNAPTNGGSLTLCRIASYGAGVNYATPVADLGYKNGVYDEDTRTFTATIPFSGQYIITNGPPVYEEPLIPELPDMPPWAPTSQTAQQLAKFGILYDRDRDILYTPKHNIIYQTIKNSYMTRELTSLMSYLDYETIYFIYDNKEWLIELRKGQFPYGTGVEAGVYNRELNGPLVKDQIAEADEYIENGKELLSQMLDKMYAESPVPIPDEIKTAVGNVIDATTPEAFQNALQKAFDVARVIASKANIGGIPGAFRDGIGAILFGFSSKVYEPVENSGIKFQIKLSERKAVWNSTPPYINIKESELFTTDVCEDIANGYILDKFTSNPNQLKAELSIRFPSKAMCDAFLDGADNASSEKNFVYKDMQIFNAYAFYNTDNFYNYYSKSYGFKKLGTGYAVYAGGTRVDFTVDAPASKQPFYATNLSSLINSSINQYITIGITQIKDIVGAKSNDPNELEELVMQYGLESLANKWVMDNYNSFLNTINNILDTFLSYVPPIIKKGSVSPVFSAVSLKQSGVMSLNSGLDEPLPYGDDLAAGLGGEGGWISINGGMVTAFGGISGTVSALPDEYIYWTNTEPSPPDNAGILVPDGVAFTNNAEYQYVKIETHTELVLYNAEDIAVVNAIISGNGLGWTEYTDNSYTANPGWTAAEWTEISGEMRITGLNVTDTGISGTIHVAGLTELEVLQCERNLGLTALTLGTHDSLRTIDLLDCPNMSGTIDASNCPSLNVLSIGNTDGGFYPEYPFGSPVSRIKLYDGTDMSFNVSPDNSGIIRVNTNNFFSSSSPVMLFAAPGTGNTFTEWTTSANYSGLVKNADGSAQFYKDSVPKAAASITANFYVPHVHDYGTIWTSDADNHWHECDCGEKTDTAAHTENSGVVTTPPTETATGIKTFSCSVCDIVLRTETIAKLPPNHTHDYGTAWAFDATNHWHECDCGEKTDTAAHSENSGVVTTPPTETATGIKTFSCEVCGKQLRTETIAKLPPNHTHDYGTAWAFDATNHWHECDCGEKTDTAAHSDGNGDHACDICGERTSLCDMTELKEAIDDAVEFMESEEFEGCSDALREAWEDALEAALAVYRNKDATQAQVNAAITRFDNLVKTGESEHIFVIGGILLLAAMGLAYTVIRKRRVN